MTLDRRELMKRTGATGVGMAIGGSVATHTVVAQDAAAEGMAFWDVLNTSPRLEIMDDVAARFSESHDGIATEHRGWTLDELSDSLPRALESDQGPDVSQVNNGESMMGPMIRSGQILPLDSYAEQYGWMDLMPAGILARNMYSEDGTTFGQGIVWGVSCESEIVGFFYNKQKFADVGVEVPTTMAEFETVMQTLKDAGEEPLVLGNLSKSPAIHLFGEIHGAYTTPEYINALIYRYPLGGGGTPEATPMSEATPVGERPSFMDQSILDAAAKFQEWKDKGFLIEGFDGMTSEDATAGFQSGDGAIMVQGSWSAAEVADGLGEDGAGFFLMPPLEAGGKVLNVGGVGIPYSISMNAEDPDLAAELLNEIVGSETLTAFLDAGILPAGEIPAEAIVDGTVAGDLYTAWNSALESDSVGHYMDWAAPGFYDVLAGELQKLLANEVTPDQFATTLQDFYAKSFE